MLPPISLLQTRKLRKQLVQLFPTRYCTAFDTDICGGIPTSIAHDLGSPPPHRIKLEHPTLPLHELAEVHTLDAEMLADVRNLCRVGFRLFHRKNGRICRRRSGDQERIRVLTATQNLLLFDVGLKVLNTVDLNYKRTLFGIGGYE